MEEYPIWKAPEGDSIKEYYVPRDYSQTITKQMEKIWKPGVLDVRERYNPGTKSVRGFTVWVDLEKAHGVY
jgi:hypothetical protein